MKTTKLNVRTILFMLTLVSTLFWACSDDDNDGGGKNPPVAEELTITDLIPDTARRLDTITITGTGFNATNKTLNSVLFSSGGVNNDGTLTAPSIPATVVTVTATELEVIVPNQVSGDGPINITVGEESVTSTQNFMLNTALPNPELIEVSPVSGYAGSTIRINAYNLGIYDNISQEVSFESLYVYFNAIEVEIQPEDVQRFTPMSGAIYDYFDVTVPEGLTIGEATISLKRDGYTSTNTLPFTVEEIPVSVAAVYWTNRSGSGGIDKGVNDESGVEITPLLSGDAKEGLVLDSENGYIYYATTTNEIKRIPMTGGTEETIYESPYHLQDLALDVESQKIYFSAYDEASWMYENIYSINTDGSDLTELYVYDIDADPDAGYILNLKLYNGNLYWVEEYKQRVMVGSVNGASEMEATVLFDSADGIDDPQGIAVDGVNNKLYIVDRGGSENIFVGNLDGSDSLSKILAGTGETDDLSYVFDVEIDVENGFLYWSNSAFATSGGAIKRISIETFEIETVFDGIDNAAYIDLEIK